jgi:hypothetical protein
MNRFALTGVRVLFVIIIKNIWLIVDLSQKVRRYLTANPKRLIIKSAYFTALKY